MKVRQSDRFDLYDEAVEQLKASGRLYPATRRRRNSSSSASASSPVGAAGL